MKMKRKRSWRKNDEKLVKKCAGNLKFQKKTVKFRKQTDKFGEKMVKNALKTSKFVIN